MRVVPEQRVRCSFVNEVVWNVVVIAKCLIFLVYEVCTRILYISVVPGTRYIVSGAYPRSQLSDVLQSICCIEIVPPVHMLFLTAPPLSPCVDCLVGSATTFRVRGLSPLFCARASFFFALFIFAPRFSFLPRRFCSDAFVAAR